MTRFALSGLSSRASALGLGLLLTAGLNSGQARADNDVVLCPADQPCIDELYQDGTTVVVGWDGHQDWDHYNFRWSRPGRNEEQHETAGGSNGSYRINNVNPDMTYTVKVQGCDRDFFGSSTCTPWYETAITTQPAALPYGPDTCIQGFVWREANPDDHVCVTPEVRARTGQENATAAQRREPGGGIYGPNTCMQGFVWREAFDGDVVCVTPDVREQTRADNAAAESRRAA